MVCEQLHRQLYLYTVGNTGFLFQRNDNNFKLLVCRMSRIIKNSQLTTACFYNGSNVWTVYWKTGSSDWLKYFVSWARLIENLVVYMDKISKPCYLHEQELYIRGFNFGRAGKSRMMFLQGIFNFSETSRIYCILFLRGEWQFEADNLENQSFLFLFSFTLRLLETGSKRHWHPYKLLWQAGDGKGENLRRSPGAGWDLPGNRPATASLAFAAFFQCQCALVRRAGSLSVLLLLLFPPRSFSTALRSSYNLLRRLGKTSELVAGLRCGAFRRGEVYNAPPPGQGRSCRFLDSARGLWGSFRRGVQTPAQPRDGGRFSSPGVGGQPALGWAEPGRNGFLVPEPNATEGCDFPFAPVWIGECFRELQWVSFKLTRNVWKSLLTPTARPLPFTHPHPAPMISCCWRHGTRSTAGWKRGREEEREPGACGSHTVPCPGAVLQGLRLPLLPGVGGVEPAEGWNVFP